MGLGQIGAGPGWPACACLPLEFALTGMNLADFDATFPLAVNFVVVVDQKVYKLGSRELYEQHPYGHGSY